MQLLHNREESARDALFLKQSFPPLSFSSIFQTFPEKVFFSLFLPEPDMNYAPRTRTVARFCTNAAACRRADMLKEKKSLIPGGNSFQTHRCPLPLTLHPSVPGRIGSERWKVSSFTYWRLRLCNDFPGELEQSAGAEQKQGRERDR